MSKHAKFVRNCARGRAKDLSHMSMSLRRSLVQRLGRIMMFASVDTFSHCLTFSHKHTFVFMVLICVL